MAEPLEIESLFAAIGLDPILRAKPTLHKYQLEKAAGYPKAMRKRLMRFLATSTFDEGTDVPPFDYDEALKVIPPGQTLAQVRALNAAVPDQDLAHDLNNQAHKILNWANTVLPREEAEAVGGLGLEPPDPHTIADFRRVWQVAADPMSLLTDLEDGSLSEDQVAAVVTLYPALYAEMRQAASDALAAVTGRKKGAEVDPTKMALLNVLRQQNTWDAALSATMQGIYNPPPPPAQPQAPKPKGKSKGKAQEQEISSTLTPGQKAAAGA